MIKVEGNLISAGTSFFPLKSEKSQSGKKKSKCWPIICLCHKFFTAGCGLIMLTRLSSWFLFGSQVTSPRIAAYLEKRHSLYDILMSSERDFYKSFDIDSSERKRSTQKKKSQGFSRNLRKKHNPNLVFSTLTVSFSRLLYLIKYTLSWREVYV